MTKNENNLGSDGRPVIISFFLNRIGLPVCLPTYLYLPTPRPWTWPESSSRIGELVPCFGGLALKGDLMGSSFTKLPTHALNSLHTLKPNNLLRTKQHHINHLYHPYNHPECHSNQLEPPCNHQHPSNHPNYSTVSATPNPKHVASHPKSKVKNT